MMKVTDRHQNVSLCTELEYKKLACRMATLDETLFALQQPLSDTVVMDSAHESERNSNNGYHGNNAYQTLTPLDAEDTEELSCIWRYIALCFTKVWSSALVLVVSFVIPGALLCVALLAYEKPEIDISLNAFQIPNHITSEREDSLIAALKEYKNAQNSGRRRRDAEHEEETLAANRFLSKDDLQSIQSPDFLESLRLHRLQRTHRQKKRVAKRGTSDFVDLMQGLFKKSSSLNQENKRHVRKRSTGERYYDQHKEAFEKILEGTREKEEGGLLSRIKRNFSPGDRTGNTYITAYTQTQPRWRMQIIYVAQGEDKEDLNIFTPERLKTIHKVEQKVMTHTHFQDFCWKPVSIREDKSLEKYDNCAPPNSLLTYFFPTKRDGKVWYDGLGENLASVKGSLMLALTHPTFYWFVDESMDEKNLKSQILRSEITFGAPLKGFRSKSDRKDEQDQQFKDWVITYIDVLDSVSTKEVGVLYGGPAIFDYEVLSTFWSDVKLALISVCLICALVFVLTSFSAWLTFFGMCSIILSFMVAFFLYRVVFQIKALGILNGVSAFVIIGIGVDDVFVFINTFRQAAHLKDPLRRMAHTVKTAGKATFFTSFTTAAAFAANMFSQIPAVHDFGLFMSLIVSSCWLMVVLVMPPTLNFWHRLFSSCEAACCTGCCRCSCAATDNLQLPPDVECFLSSHDPQQSSGRQDSEDDIPMLTMEEVGLVEDVQSDDDVMLLDLNMEDLPILQQEGERMEDSIKQEGCHLSVRLQGLMYHYVAVPVVKARWAIVVVYMALLAGSLVLVTQLTPASHPPELFQPNTNLQRLLNMKNNFTEALGCTDCSGLFKDKNKVVDSTSDKVTKAMSPDNPAPLHGQQKPTEDQQHHVTPAPPGSHIGTAGFISNRSISPPLPTTTTTVPTTTTTTTTHRSTTVKRSADNSHGCSAECAANGYRCVQYRRRYICCSLTCYGGGRCMIHNGKPQCLCPHGCPETTSESDKVCGSDGIVYKSMCELHLFSCRYSLDIHQDSWETCKERSDGMISVHPTQPSVDQDFDPCTEVDCNPAPRPLLQISALVFVVFGIKGVDRTNVTAEHVLQDQGKVIYDENFEVLSGQTIDELCKMCKAIANNRRLVKPGGAQCFPPDAERYLQTLMPGGKAFDQYPSCMDLPKPNLVHGERTKAAVGIIGREVRWVAMSFESTTYKGQSSFSSYHDYQAWEAFLKQEIDKLPANSGLKSGFQTCDYWKEIFMEIVGVSSAIYGLVLSMVICILAVVVFTGHVMLLFIVFFTILGVICSVVAVFFIAGWQIGAVEAISLSILVGSSVDYCAHLIEGYLLAGKNPPTQALQSNAELRRWRAKVAVSHIGVSIISSAVTTIIAAIPLCFTTFVPFSKFGEIVAINTAMSILYALTACTAFLAVAAPAKFQSTWKASLKALIGAAVVLSLAVLACYVAYREGVIIPGPDGNSLFH
ncbi:protein dispatched homolog 3-like [Branchiostoma floridae]|uniref:Protein dispatched homolog 3-like n=1 Tax=Branchiostoma floridae TaxID=7739 RepID=A0A9J7M9C4_BRAFL|nr:protein dispatched homolog 3-like [Branchiostoma floridae]